MHIYACLCVCVRVCVWLRVSAIAEITKIIYSFSYLLFVYLYANTHLWVIVLIVGKYIFTDLNAQFKH